MRTIISILTCLMLAIACQAEEIVCFNMDSDPGWTTEGQWEFGIPQGGGGPYSYDPCSGYTGDNVYGYNLAGNYDNDMPEYKLTTSAIDCKLAENVTLSFYRWLGVESSLFDHAKVQVSNNGTDWVDVWENGASNLIDTEWVYCEYDISAVADRQETVYIRWCMGPTDSSFAYAGWNIDDVCLEGDVFDALAISSVDGFYSVGPEGGPFSPECESYTLTNEGASDVNWAAEANESWLEISPGSGTLAPDSNVVVNVCISADANLLSEGLYTDTLSFTNINTGFSHEIDATLYVGADIVVPLDYSTIQAAIDASSNGDTIVVMPGTYTGSGNKNINFEGKAITLRSIDPDNLDIVTATIINCNGWWMIKCRGFIFNHDEGSDSVLSGLTITNAFYYTYYDDEVTYEYYGGPGGAIYCESSPTILNCVMKNSQLCLGGKGGGMYNSGNPTVINCSFENNRPWDEMEYYGIYGGGVFNSGSITMIDCTFKHNASRGDYDAYGGGMYNEGIATLINCTFTSNSEAGMYNNLHGNAELIDCTFTMNSGGGINNYGGNAELINCSFNLNSGGGLSNSGGGLTVQDCNFIDNSSVFSSGARGDGGGIFNTGNATVTNCTFSNNYATDDGGGMYLSDGNATLTNCIFNGNHTFDISSQRDGGGIYNSNSNPVIINCTFVGNSSDSGGGIYNSNGKLYLTNCIFWGNNDDGGTDESAQIHTTGAGGPIINYSCVQGWTGGFGGIGNFGDDPCFVSGPLGDYYLSQIAAGQASDSPCVDTGSDTAVHLGLNTFTTRTDEVVDFGVVDMGYHYPSPFMICSADIDEDGYVDFVDYALFAADFGLNLPDCNELSSDLYVDCIIDFTDLAVLVDSWLYCYVGLAHDPNPSNSSETINPNVVLSWTPGEYAVSHDVYFGTNYVDVNNATVDSNEYMGNFDINSYDPNGLELETTYYWRVDEIGASCTAKGDVWEFTWAEPNSYLIGWWKFDEGEGDIAYDSAGGNHGTIYGATWTTGKIDGALEFDGFGDNVDCGSDASLDVTELTWALWIKRAETTYTDERALISNEGGGPNTQGTYALQIDTGGDYQDKIQFLRHGVPVEHSPLSSTAIQDMYWHHIAVTRDDSGIVVIYIDGLQDASGYCAERTAFTATVIGTGHTGYSDFYGKIDDVRIYNTALFAEQIWQIYRQELGKKASSPYPVDGATDVDPDVVLSWLPGKYAVSHDVYLGLDYNDVNNATSDSNEFMGNQSETSWDTSNYDVNGLDLLTIYYWRIDEVNGPNVWKGDIWEFATWDEPNAYLVGWWRFDEGEGGIAYDSAGTNHGTIYGATWTTGQIDGALDFDGDQDYILIPDSDSISVGTSDYTIVAWIYPRTIAIQNDIVSKVKDSADKEYEFSIHDGELKLDVETNSNNQQAVTTTTPVVINSWQYVAVTFDSSNTLPTFYHNAAFQESSSNIDTLPDELSDDLYIGMRGGGYLDNEFDGLIDDVRIYDRVLTAEEIWQLYLEGL